jgi:hypothetical protein
MPLLAQRGRRGPPFAQEAVVNARPVVPGVERPVQGRDTSPTPPTSHGRYAQPDVRPLVPVTMPVQGLNTRVQGRGHASEAANRGILLRLLASGR